METIAARSHRLPGSTFACAAFALAAAACSGNTSGTSATSPAPLEYPLQSSAVVVNDVQSSVPGLTPTQTAQGMGAILYAAQLSMQPGDFAKVKGAFPGSDAMINEGTKLGMPSEFVGRTSLAGSLKNIGISRDEFAQLVVAMKDVVSDKAGPEVAQYFATVFM